MNISFGNLSVIELDKRHQLGLTKEEIDDLEKYRSDNTKLTDNTFHIYNLPESIHIKGDEIRNKIIEILGKYSDNFKYGVKVYDEGDK